jgi:REP element-mobilizing transposase RayT
MAQPRPVIPNSFYLITRRCTQRQFLMRPDDATNNAYLYCLIVAALRFEIDVLLMCAMSNHHHVVIFDRLGRYPEFIEHFHKLFARSQNALRGRWENFWTSTQTSVVRLENREDVVNKLVYTATNPVNDHLVERVHHWPGVCGLRALITGKALRATRPRHFFRKDGPMPLEVEMTLRVPPELDGDVLDEVERLVAQIEERAAVERNRTGRRVLGRRRILRQRWDAAPTTFDPHREMSPRIAAADAQSRIDAIERQRLFVSAHRAARESWLRGLVCPFPFGTYRLRRLVGVPIANSP